MYIKKTLAIAAVVAMSSAFAIPAFAHGHHGYYRQTQATVNCPAICTIEGCTEPGRHTHDGVEYCGYNHSCGYCDGSCITQNNYGYGCGGGHHGCY